MSAVSFKEPVHTIECNCPCGFSALVICEIDDYIEYCPRCGLDGYDSPAPEATDVEMAARIARKREL